MPPATLDQSAIDLADIAMDACHMGHAGQPIENIVDFLRRQFHIWTFWRGNFVSDECWTFLVREQNLMRALTRTMRSTFIGHIIVFFSSLYSTGVKKNKSYQFWKVNVLLLTNQGNIVIIFSRGGGGGGGGVGGLPKPYKALLTLS